MKNTTLLAAILAAGVSGAAIAQTMDNGSANTPAGATTDNTMGSGSMNGGAMAPGDQANSTVPDAAGGPTRPNSEFGAQEPSQADTTPGVNEPQTTRDADSTETRAPLKGANSFTMGEAQRRLEKAGYTNVTGLAKDDQSVWRGIATDKNGQSVAVAMDYRGNITATQK
jgi:putative membrane protein